MKLKKTHPKGSTIPKEVKARLLNRFSKYQEDYKVKFKEYTEADISDSDYHHKREDYLMAYTKLNTIELALIIQGWEIVGKEDID